MAFIDIYVVGPGAAGSNQKQKLWVPDLEWYTLSRWVNRISLNTNDKFFFNFLNSGVFDRDDDTIQETRLY